MGVVVGVVLISNQIATHDSSVRIHVFLGVVKTSYVLTIAHGFWPNFFVTLKIYKKSNFDWNQLKVSTQHKYMYMYQKKL